MKKIVLGLGVLGVYLVYSIGIRHQDPVIAKPASLLSSSKTLASGSGNSTVAGSTAGNSSKASSSAPSASAAPASGGQYQDGTYTGSSVNVFYGNVQVSVKIAGGVIKNVSFLQYPNSHSTSVMINQQAMPYLIQEAIQAQSAHVQIISGATFTSEGFQQSLQAALAKA